MAFPDPSSNCRHGGSADDVPGVDRCYGTNGATDPDPQLKHPGRPIGRNSFGDRLRGPNVSDAFNFGLLLLPYVLDHGDKLGIMTRKKAYVTILHSWARASDRSYALRCVEAFVSKRDGGRSAFLDYLCEAPPFAGYRWSAVPLLRWQAFARSQASALGPEKSLEPAAAAAAAIAWCDAVRGEWGALTVERFPYSPPDLVGYWLRDAAPTSLPAADPVSAGLEPPP